MMAVEPGWIRAAATVSGVGTATASRVLVERQRERETGGRGEREQHQQDEPPARGEVDRRLQHLRRGGGVAHQRRQARRAGTGRRAHQHRAEERAPPAARGRSPRASGTGCRGRRDPHRATRRGSRRACASAPRKIPPTIHAAPPAARAAETAVSARVTGAIARSSSFSPASSCDPGVPAARCRRDRPAAGAGRRPTPSPLRTPPARSPQGRAEHRELSSSAGQTERVGEDVLELLSGRDLHDLCADLASSPGGVGVRLRPTGRGRRRVTCRARSAAARATPCGCRSASRRDTCACRRAVR